MTAFDFNDRHVVIAGGAGHIGRAIVNGILKAGGSVTILDLPTAITAMREDGAKAGTRVAYEPCDLAEETAVRDAADRILASRDRIDGLVHAAALVNQGNDEGYATAFEKQTYDLWRRGMDINLGSVFLLAQAMAPRMAETGNASILLFGSIYGVLGPDFRLYDGLKLNSAAAYAASKGGTIQLVRWLATALAPKIRVNAISPGGLERGQGAAFVERYIARCPQGRMASEADIVGPSLFLLSDHADYITGQNLMVDGGWSAW
jgi:NAD(P)-dependent dehydrogenase (short-subunit alcohol dehydrogenase family)